jgi:iron complex outermembrane receptor protein
MSGSLSFKSRVLMGSSALALGALFTLGPVQVVHAQDSGTQKAQTIVVTGSRIVRRDFSAQSPIVTLNAQDLQTTSSVGLEQALDKLPQFVAGANQVTGAPNVQSTALSTPGASTLNLRGLGSNRNLVLIDGRRAQPIDAGLDIDINTIPSAAIESVETITGGAAATYGSDAISGVVNFKLKHDYQGAELDAQWGEAAAGDDKETKISALIGGNFADGKGNAMLSVSYSDRTAVLNRDREFYSKAYTDPTVGGDFFPNVISLSGPSALQGDLTNFRTYPYSQAALDSIFGAGEVNPVNTTFAAGLGINPASNPANATVYYLGRGASGTQAPGFINPGTTVGGAPVYKYVNTNDYTGITTNPVNQMLSLPLTRYSLFTSAHYDVNENVTAYMQGNFVETETLTILGSNPAVNQYGVFIPYDGGDGSTATITVTDPISGVASTISSPHLVPTQVATLLQSRTPDPLKGNSQTATSDWELGQGLSPILGPRSQAQNFNTYQVIGGFRGNLPFLPDWTYDIYGSHGNTASPIWPITRL